jgi:MFS family permease
MVEKTRWGAVTALLFAGIVVALQIGKAAVALPVLQRELSLSLVLASWIFGAYAVLGAGGGLPAGILASLFSARRGLVAGLVTAGIGSLAGALATSGGLLIATRVLEGCGFLAAVLAGPRLLNAVTAPRDRDTVMALWGCYMPGGSVIMMVIGPQILTHGWETLWIVNGVIALAYALVIARLRIVEEPQANEDAPSLVSNIRTALGAPLLLGLAFGIYTFQYAAMAGLLPTLLVDRLGLSVAAAGAVSAFTVAANAVGNLLAGVLMRFGAPLWGIAAFAYAFVTVAGFGVFAEGMPVVVIATLAAANLAITGMIPASIFAAAPLFARTAALMAIVIGLVTQASNIGILLGPAAMAYIAEHFGWARTPWLFVSVTACGLVLAFVMRAVMRRTPAA